MIVDVRYHLLGIRACVFLGAKEKGKVKRWEKLVSVVGWLGLLSACHSGSE